MEIGNLKATKPVSDEKRYSFVEAIDSIIENEAEDAQEAVPEEAVEVKKSVRLPPADDLAVISSTLTEMKELKLLELIYSSDLMTEKQARRLIDRYIDDDKEYFYQIAAYIGNLLD